MDKQAENCGSQSLDVAAKDELGYIDSIDPSAYYISGWVLSHPDGTVTAPLLKINGNVVSVLNLTGDRDDATALYGRQAVGVYFKFARYLVAGQNRLEVVYASTGTVLPNGSCDVNFDRDQLVGAHWSHEYANDAPLRTRWWFSDFIIRAINQRVCGEAVPGLSAGLYRAVSRQFAAVLPASRAVSVGSGFGEKEMDAIDAGLATSFDLFEVSETAVEHGRALAQARGLSQHVTFYLEDAFKFVSSTEVYDLVFWNNALHHMTDTRQAVLWSHRVLKPGGLFVMDDYVGATLLQYPEGMLQMSTKFRSTIPERYLQSPYDPTQMLDVCCVAPDKDDLFVLDPSEGADSANILPAIREIFPSVQSFPTGGGVYHLGLSDVLSNVSETDVDILNYAMALDDQCVAMGLTQYAVAYGQKESSPNLTQSGA